MGLDKGVERLGEEVGQLGIAARVGTAAVALLSPPPVLIENRVRATKIVKIERIQKFHRAQYHTPIPSSPIPCSQDLTS